MLYDNYSNEESEKQGKSNKKQAVQTRLIEKRKQNEELSKIVAVYDNYKAMKLLECGTYVEIDNVLKANGELKQRITNANFCKLRICPMCSWRRSRRIYSDVLKATTELQKNKEYRYILLTLTVKNCKAEELNETVNKLLKSFASLRHKKAFKEQIKGYFRALEITYNKERNDYHPHIHCILVVDSNYFRGSNYIKQEKWCKMWQECLKVDYIPSVDIRNIKGETRKAVCEVAKYTVKPIDFFQKDIKRSVEIVKTIDEAIKGVRLIQYGGIYQKVRKELKIKSMSDMNLNDGYVEIDKNDILIKTIHSWNFGAKTYNLVRMK